MQKGGSWAPSGLHLNLYTNRTLEKHTHMNVLQREGVKTADDIAKGSKCAPVDYIER